MLQSEILLFKTKSHRIALLKSKIKQKHGYLVSKTQNMLALHGFNVNVTLELNTFLPLKTFKFS